jgi:glycosyltransferase involved in cell wall biosynthesis
MENYYKQEVKIMNLSDRVVFANKINEIEKAELLQRSSVLVLPSISGNEAFGLVLLEAMASGVPVIASDLPGVRSVFNQGVEGFYTKPGDENDLVEKLKIILSDEVLRVKMGNSARNLAVNKYNEKKVSSQLNAVYNKIINN